MKTVIIIPTYNEKDNIENLIFDLQKVFKNVPGGFQMHILVVDDTSPDGTADIVKKIMKKNNNVHLLINPEKKGLGAAYIKGIKYAMEKLSADLVFEFDADGSHQPKYIPGMLEEIKKGGDVVVGSRYIPGGTMPEDWGVDRKIISFFGNFIARVVLFTFQYKDMTSGYRVTKTSFLKKIDLDNLLSKQFAYKLHLYYALHKLKAKIIEFPIEFIDRTKGYTKFPKNNIIDSLRVVFTLRYREWQRFIKFAVVGGTGFVIQTIAFSILLELDIHRSIAVSIGAELAIISNFTFNNIWTFKSHKISGLKIIPKFLGFNFTSLLAIGIQALILWLGPIMMGVSKLSIWISYFVALVIVMIVNFTIYNKLIWKTQEKNK